MLADIWPGLHHSGPAQKSVSLRCETPCPQHASPETSPGWRQWRGRWEQRNHNAFWTLLGCANRIPSPLLSASECLDNRMGPPGSQRVEVILRKMTPVIWRGHLLYEISGQMPKITFNEAWFVFSKNNRDCQWDGQEGKGAFCKASVQLLLCNIFLKLKNAS